MAKLLASRAAQTVLVQEFTFDFLAASDDKMATVVGNVIGGASPNYLSTTQAIRTPTGAQIYEVFPLPPGATVVAGELVVTTLLGGPTTSTITVGDSGSATRYLGSTSLKTAARTALVPTGYVGTGENVRVTINNDASATTGKVTLRLSYTVAGRTSEVIVA